MAYVNRYGAFVPDTALPLAVEMEFIKKGGRYLVPKRKVMAGRGLVYHYKEAIRYLWPDIKFHKWLDMIVENYVDHRTIIIIGPASSGKTLGAAMCALLDYYCFPSCTTIIICSTTKERLEDRIWGEIKRLHKAARERWNWLPGNLIEGKLRLVTDPRSMASEGRDFRNGVVGVPCKKGDKFLGLQDFVGIKNKRVRLIGDELSMLPRAWVDSISNLDKNPDFKAVGLGNPKDTTDALGVLAEPASHLGGWDGGLDQTPISKVWEIRRPNGVCIQLVGSESPNLDGKMGIPLLTQEQIDRDVAFYGRESIQFSMMCQGMMPRGNGSRRVITRQLCLKHHALDDPVWNTNNRTRIAFLDAAYRGVGGDRCVFGELQFGEEAKTAADQPGNEIVQAIIAQRTDLPPKRQIIALIDTTIVPIKAAEVGNTPEDQIVAFVMEQCKQRGIPAENFFFDSGMRTSLVSAFARLWSPRVCPIDCGGKPTDRRVSYDIDILCKDYYQKYITELWYSVRLAIEAEQFRGLTEDVILEFSSREYGLVGGNKIEVEPKDKMKEKTGRSPDLADAVAIGVEGARQRGFMIRKLGNPAKVTSNNRWKTELRDKATALWKSGQLTYN